MPGSRKRIALNAQLVRLDSTYRSAGIARYIYNLCRALQASSEFEYHIFTGEASAKRTLSQVSLHLTRWPTASPSLRIAWEQLAFPLHLLKGRFDLCHACAYVSPVLARGPSVVTVYDISFALYPGYFRAGNRLYLTWGTGRSVKHARRVIAISESTKRDLVRSFNLRPDKVDVIPPGVEPEFFAAADLRALERVRSARNLPEQFVLYVGTLEPRKDIPGLIRAFARCKARLGLSHRLVLAGGRGWMDQEIGRAIHEANAEQDVILPGFIPQSELPYWYRAADAFVYPSRYEGFGMPPLEAQACGTPVITTNASSLPEAVGDAALLFPPGDEAKLELALERLLTDRALRDDLCLRGTERARRFTWERAARATVEVYRRALNGEGSSS